MHIITGLKYSKGEYNSYIHSFTLACKNEILLWHDNISEAKLHIKTEPEIDLIIHTDASNAGMGSYSGSISIG